MKREKRNRTSDLIITAGVVLAVLALIMHYERYRSEPAFLPAILFAAGYLLTAAGYMLRYRRLPDPKKRILCLMLSFFGLSASFGSFPLRIIVFGNVYHPAVGLARAAGLACIFISEALYERPDRESGSFDER